MEPISLILAALLAGVVKGTSESAAKGVRDAYQGLRAALKRRLADKPAAQDAVEQYARDPEQWKGNVEVHLRQAGADADQAILEAAATVLRLAKQDAGMAGKYNVNLAGAQGVQVGDGGTQTNHFGALLHQAPGTYDSAGLAGGDASEPKT